MFHLQSSSKSKKKLKIYCLAWKHNQQKNTFDSTNIWVSWPMNTRKPGKTVGPALKAVSNIQTNPINLYKTFLMANMKHKPCNLWHQHCFSFPTFPLFHHHYCHYLWDQTILTLQIYLLISAFQLLNVSENPSFLFLDVPRRNNQ